MNDIRRRAIESGVRSLREFGYPTVNADNIMTDKVYRAFFRSQLEEAASLGDNSKISDVLRSMISEIDAIA